ncbi:hypothetical protein BAY61_24535 [Prauserella marina]|uniref:Uncharacterized protein n=1 Tax=Prauserella marina TaxID=530584 RepID=A0A222VUR6_9PSEU|nr:hypothetical protein BAY61_24535 [Prauserella marina]PWV75566.1 hypothetical protein DES30_106183 [Prauserella marina]SDD31716.1 hypothetical protein SAMN05421630_107257 [Prauserella marina]
MLDAFCWHCNLERPHRANSYRKRKIQVGAQLVCQTVHTVEGNGIVRIYYSGHQLVRELL